MSTMLTIECLEDRLVPSTWHFWGGHSGHQQHQVQSQYESQSQSQHQSISISISIQVSGSSGTPIVFSMTEG